jgi:putative restriction endonuclease
VDQLWTDDESPNPADYWVERVTSIGRFKSRGKDKRAPYKPLLLLWVIGRLAGGLPGRVSFREAEEDLQRLLSKHPVGRSKPKVENPFVYLASDPELWRVEDSDGGDIARLEQRKKMSPPFLRANATGALAPEFDRALRDQNVRSRVVNELLRMDFPETLHEEILEDVGLGHVVVPAPQRRDPRFKGLVLQAYENRCSFCGYDVRLGNAPVGIEAAHVRMRARGGPDRIENGLALCVQHHRLFDYGALGLDENHRILVSEHLNLSDQESSDRIGGLVGLRIRKPLRRYRLPSDEHIDWHLNNLFKHPAR